MKQLFSSLVKFRVYKEGDDVIVHSIEVSDQLSAKNVLKWVTITISPVMTMLTLVLTIVKAVR
jgi:hypothetical protein